MIMHTSELNRPCLEGLWGSRYFQVARFQSTSGGTRTLGLIFGRLIMQRDRIALFVIPALLGSIVGLTFPARAATDVWSPHIAAGDWRTTIALYNATDGMVTCQLAKFRSDGSSVEPAKQFIVSARDWFVLSAEELYFDGTARLTSADDLLVKTSYQYMNSHSLCEFYLSAAMATDWVIPNSVRDWLAWTGVALINPTNFPVQVELKAWRQGIEIGSQILQLAPRQKLARLSQEIWPGVLYQDFDTVRIKSDQPIPAPIGIMGDEGNGRHLFFTAQVHPAPARTLHVWAAHIAAGDWNTSMSLFNSSDDAAALRLEKYAADGSALGGAPDFTVPPNAWFAIPASELDFDGAARLTSSRRLLVKLNYQYRDSRSVCALYLPDRLAMSWAMPNSVRDWFSWTGVALINQTSVPVTVTLKALQAGVEKGASTIRLAGHSKSSRLSDQIWEGMSYRDFDTILVQSSAAIPAPILITGDADQQRHVFFTAREKLPILPEPVNAVKNGSFEAGAELPSEWQSSISGNAAVARVVGVSPAGSAHVEIYSDNQSSYAALYQTVPVNPGWPSLITTQTSYSGSGSGRMGLTDGGASVTSTYFSRWLGISPWGIRPTNYFFPRVSAGSISILGGWGSTVNFDDIQFLQWDPSRIDGFEYVRHLTGSAVYRVEGVELVQGQGQVSFPLPLIHQGQTPLAIRVYTEPAGRIARLTFDEKWNRNWIATAQIDAPDQTRLHFEALILACEISAEARAADLESEPRDPSDWLTATMIVQSDDPQIRAAAAAAIGGATKDLGKLINILGWLKNYMTGSTAGPALDAKTAFQYRRSSCTGWANLASALGRAAGIPTRTVAGYPAWGSPLQTHYVNEFYLKDLGWCRVEPQPITTLAWPYVNQSYINIVSIIQPEQEGYEAMHHVGNWIGSGVPFLSLTEISGSITPFLNIGWFESCSNCDHASAGKFNIHLDELGRLPYVAEVARDRWRLFLEDAVTGRAQEWMERRFTAMFAAQSLDELEDALFVK
jgi:hypothetical protein